MALNNKKNLINILYGNKDDENLIDVDKSGYNQNALVVYLLYIYTNTYHDYANCIHLGCLRLGVYWPFE